tara:strand:+ start:759 stop:1349 length:591 start_codon:yes stop_codon:yes gene_type:complete
MATDALHTIVPTLLHDGKGTITARFDYTKVGIREMKRLGVLASNIINMGHPDVMAFMEPLTVQAVEKKWFRKGRDAISMTPDPIPDAVPPFDGVQFRVHHSTGPRNYIDIDFHQQHPHYLFCLFTGRGFVEACDMIINKEERHTLSEDEGRARHVEGIMNMVQAVIGTPTGPQPGGSLIINGVLQPPPSTRPSPGP